MFNKLRDAVFPGLRLQSKYKIAGTNRDELDNSPLSDFNAAIDPAVVVASASKPLLSTITADTTQPSKSKTHSALPSYNEVVTATLGGRGNPPSQLLQMFFHGGKVNCLGLNTAVQPVVCLYYDLMDAAASYVIPKRLMDSGILDVKTPAMTRLVIDSVANYAFMLAITHTSNRYLLKYDISLCHNEEFLAIRAHVRSEILRGFLDSMMPTNFEDTSSSADTTGIPYSDSEDTLAARTSKFVDRLVDWLEFERDCERDRYADINSTMDTGELDGPKLQECWRLFKAALTRVGSGMQDLLPPLGYKKRQGPMQTCLRPLFDRECDSPGACPLSRVKVSRRKKMKGAPRTTT